MVSSKNEEQDQDQYEQAYADIHFELLRVVTERIGPRASETRLFAEAQIDASVVMCAACAVEQTSSAQIHKLRGLARVKEFVMKLSSLPAWFVAVIATGAAFAQLPEVQPQPAPKGTVAQAVDDSTITSRVKDAISSDPALKDMEFTVDTTDSVVTLNGTANARDQIARAVALARAVPGVKSVTNILAVKTS